MPESECGIRRRWSEAFKRQVVAEVSAPGVSVAAVARRHELNANLIFNWRRRYGSAGVFLPVQVVPDGSAVSGPVEGAAAAAVSLGAAEPERIGITLTNGRCLDIALLVDDRTLVRLVRVLEQA